MLGFVWMPAPCDVVASACVRAGSPAASAVFCSTPIMAMLAHVAFHICFLLILSHPSLTWRTTRKPRVTSRRNET